MTNFGDSYSILNKFRDSSLNLSNFPLTPVATSFTIPQQAVTLLIVWITLHRIVSTFKATYHLGGIFSVNAALVLEKKAVHLDTFSSKNSQSNFHDPFQP